MDIGILPVPALFLIIQVSKCGTGPVSAYDSSHRTNHTWVLCSSLKSFFVAYATSKTDQGARGDFPLFIGYENIWRCTWSFSKKLTPYSAWFFWLTGVSPMVANHTLSQLTPEVKKTMAKHGIGESWPIISSAQFWTSWYSSYASLGCGSKRLKATSQSFHACCSW